MCTGRCLGGGDGRGGYFSPLFLFIGSLTTARTAAAPPLSCLPRLPPLSPSAERRNSMPIRFGAQRQPDQRPGRGAGGSRVGRAGCVPPGSGHPLCVQPKLPGSDWEGPAHPHPVKGFRELRGGDELAGGGNRAVPAPRWPLKGWRLEVVSWRAWPLGRALKDFGN